MREIIVMVIIKYKPKVSELFCDKLYITLKISHQHQSDVLAEFGNMTDVGYAKKTYKGGYHHSAYLLVDDYSYYENKPHILIQCKPKKSTHKYFRIEFNPSKLNEYEWWNLKQRLDQLLPYGYSSLMIDGICNRIDLAIDIYYLRINRMLAYYPKATKSKAFFKSGTTQEKESEIGSYYIGGENSKVQLIIYDKAKQLKDVKGEKVKRDITRIEFRLHPKIVMKFLNKLPNPFLKLEIADLHLIPEKDYTFTWFLDSVKQRGLQDALQIIPSSNQKLRKKYKDTIKQSKPDWYDPKEVWKHYPDVLKQLQLNAFKDVSLLECVA